MKRFLATFMLIVCLSFPAFAGHVQGGGFCIGTPVDGTCPICGPSGITVAHDQENDSVIQNTSDDAEPMLQLGVIRMAFLTWLKLKA